MKKLLKNYGFIITMLAGVIGGCIVGAFFPMVKQGDVVLDPGATVLEPLGTVLRTLMFCAGPGSVPGGGGRSGRDPGSG